MHPKEWLKRGLYFVYEHTDEAYTPSHYNSRIDLLLSSFHAKSRTIRTLSVISLKDKLFVIKEEVDSTRQNLIEKKTKEKKSYHNWFVNKNNLKHYGNGFRYIIDPDVKIGKSVKIIDRKYRVIGKKFVETPQGKFEAWVLHCKYKWKPGTADEFQYDEVCKYEIFSGLMLELKVKTVIVNTKDKESADQVGAASIKLVSTNFRFPYVNSSIPESERILKNLENELRQFLIKKLSAYSKNWWNERIPVKIKNQPFERMRKDEISTEKVEGFELINYVDFSDYRKIICKDENWNDIFKNYFFDKEIVSVKLKELERIRNSIAHNRKLDSYQTQLLELHNAFMLKCIQKNDNALGW